MSVLVGAWNVYGTLCRVARANHEISIFPLPSSTERNGNGKDFTFLSRYSCISSNSRVNQDMLIGEAEGYTHGPSCVRDPTIRPSSSERGAPCTSQRLDGVRVTMIGEGEGESEGEGEGEG